MGKIAVVTDSNSGITQKQAEDLGVFVVPMPVNIDDKTYYEGIDIERDTFYKMLSENRNISTSQPLPGDIFKLWDELLINYEEIIYLPMSSSLSKSYETAVQLSYEFEDKVHIVNNQRISVTQRESVLDALQMVKIDMSGYEIKEALENDKDNSSIYIMVDSLKSLKKGGRITPTVATIGTLLKIKPVLQIQGGLLDSFGKARTKNAAKKIILNALEEDVLNRFHVGQEGNQVLLQIAHTCKDEEAQMFKEELEEIAQGYSIYVDHLPLSIACHVGEGALGVGCIKKMKVESLITEKKLVMR